MSLANSFYNIIVKRNSIYVGTIFAGAFGFGIAFDTLTEKWWDYHNKGKQWKDIRHKYVSDDAEE
ncbi:Similar to S.cerevisiae protein QCR9 (Subunit 9 of ubiquinol cytochrome-c reductase (Complex III)) [Malassezia sympodialis ATCC 42132]|uniref:Complex III subunit 9 n=1 Tax=Malassezia sympodialis (strain ATCC 42132) TaxID=1230383 RepID=A0A1M8A9R8_MALS4|nr:Similar to S.cerevisiae protein QCR9 (Subunit 9 of ubiquinol cytochrome-c reductase (Complex III)) [Malassezia sympodialis ATCC 42132]